MSSSQKNSTKNLPKKAKKSATLQLKGEVYLSYYALSDDMLKQIEEYSSSSFDLDISLFSFSIFISLVTLTLTTDIPNKLIFAILLSLAFISFQIGILKFISHKKSKKGMSNILKKIRNQKLT